MQASPCTWQETQKSEVDIFFWHIKWWDLLVHRAHPMHQPWYAQVNSWKHTSVGSIGIAAQIHLVSIPMMTYYSLFKQKIDSLKRLIKIVSYIKARQKERKTSWNSIYWSLKKKTLRYLPQIFGLSHLQKNSTDHKTASFSTTLGLYCSSL